RHPGRGAQPRLTSARWRAWTATVLCRRGSRTATVPVWTVVSVPPPRSWVFHLAQPVATLTWPRTSQRPRATALGGRATPRAPALQAPNAPPDSVTWAGAFAVAWSTRKIPPPNAARRLWPATTAVSWTVP